MRTNIIIVFVAMLLLAACAASQDNPNVIVGDVEEEPQTPTGDAEEELASCAKEGEQYSSVYEEYPKTCCEGLTAVSSGMDTRISIADTCYATGLLAGNPVGTCIACGDGVCSDKENPCSCPSDCVGVGKSTYETMNEFCEAAERYCREPTDNLKPLCNACSDIES